MPGSRSSSHRAATANRRSSRSSPSSSAGHRSIVDVPATIEPGTFAASLRRALRRAGLLLRCRGARGRRGRVAARAARHAIRSRPRRGRRRSSPGRAEAGEVADLAAMLGEPHRIVVAGQSMPAWSKPPSVDVRLGAAELSFESGEIADYAQLVGRPLDATESGCHRLRHRRLAGGGGTCRRGGRDRAASAA